MQKNEQFFIFSLILKSYKKHLVFFLHWRVSLQSLSQKQVILGRKTWHFIIALRYTHQIWKTNHDWLHFLSRFVLFKHSIILIFVGATSIKGSAMTSIARAGASAGPRPNKQRNGEQNANAAQSLQVGKIGLLCGQGYFLPLPPHSNTFSRVEEKNCVCVIERERDRQG